ncbi:hypothetical protein HMPREF0576_1160 [Mobiluncus holmesii ATCC 35242]|uniref:Uncharacterized protein n=1 Tax=Mobiluncus holmesii ATCC 35242 TaxID=887899 RepID=E6M4H8_9ACTO|nr:hypothetical protein HMPREF0576_1160 [Mobiluncus holmesii ATCC 35242]
MTTTLSSFGTGISRVPTPWYLPSIYPEFLTLYYPEEGFI